MGVTDPLPACAVGLTQKIMVRFDDFLLIRIYLPWVRRRLWERTALKVEDAAWEKEVIQSPGVVMVDFWAVWCGPCQMVAPIVDEIATEYAGKLKVLKLNTDEIGGSRPVSDHEHSHDPLF